MAHTHTVQTRYRLNPKDITAARVAVTIQNVSYQGLEDLNPVLHLAEYPGKPLVLNRQQCAELSKVTQSALPAAWIGRVIVLQVQNQADPPVIGITAPQQQPVPIVTSRPRANHYGKLWSILLLFLILAAAFGAVYLLERLDQLR